MDTPADGSTASWPLTVGGHITGADESLRLAVYDNAGRPGAVGVTCCQPAGEDPYDGGHV